MIKRIIDTILPFVANYKDNKKIRKNLDQPEAQLKHVENSEIITIDVLKDQYTCTIQAKDKLEDKAKSNIIAVTISITLILGASNLINIINSKFPYLSLYWVSFILLLAAVIYMIIAGILSIGVLIDENKVYTVKLESFALSEADLRHDYDICTVLNKAQNLIRNNGVYTSYECIRNAFVCLFIILILATVPYSTKQSTPLNSALCNYSFIYTSEAVRDILKNNNQAIVEAIIIEAINKREILDSTPTGLINKSERLFIKVRLEDKTITVLIIEHFNKLSDMSTLCGG